MARCRSCGQSFCRECVVEHERRLVCAACLRAEMEGGQARSGGGRRHRVPWAAVLQWAAALTALWALFYAAAAALGRIPAEIHDGLIWLQN